MNFNPLPQSYSIGWAIALIGLVIVLFLAFFVDDPLTRENILLLFGMGFLARLL